MVKTRRSWRVFIFFAQRIRMVLRILRGGQMRFLMMKWLSQKCKKEGRDKILLGCDTMGERIGRIGRIQTDFF
jgi:hypothetical protein